MTRDEQRSKLIQIAAALLTKDRGPSMYLTDHEHLPKRVPKRWWNWICGKLMDADDQRRDWAREISKVADAIGSADTGSAVTTKGIDN